MFQYRLRTWQWLPAPAHTIFSLHIFCHLVPNVKLKPWLTFNIFVFHKFVKFQLFCLNFTLVGDTSPLCLYLSEIRSRKPEPDEKKRLYPTMYCRQPVQYVLCPHCSISGGPKTLDLKCFIRGSRTRETADGQMFYWPISVYTLHWWARVFKILSR